MSDSENSAPRVRRPRVTATPEVAALEPTATPTATPTPTAATPPPGAAAEASARPRNNMGALVAVAAIAALVGGASGAGIAAWAVASNTADQQSAAGPQTITVNDPDGVNVVNAVAAKAGPSVVTISVSSQSAGGSGSGVILSEDGYVLTNNHVVTLDGASSDGTIEVTTADGRIFSAEIVGTDPTVDLAVIKLVDARELTPIEFGDVDALDVGDRAVVIGAPLGLANTVTDGIVSVLNRSIQIASSAVPDDGTEDDSEGGQNPFNFDIPGQQSTAGRGTISLPVIQTDASINPGNSGGALVNDSGELIGVVVAIASAGGSNTTSGSIGVGFAIPADLAQRVADEIIDNGTATHGLLGATVRDASSADGSIVGAVIVDEEGIVSGGAAEVAGLQPGDTITELDGVPIAGSIDLTAQVRRHAAGAKAELVYVRDGDEHTVTVTLGAYQP
ncbi:MAG TPA: trypsin-like peptidase domain-containing protein [Pseudolysinimonas sp.]|nr:trypsin-like peptidase domain-containing protein [Pseudolysinimonas sp.]